MFIPKCELPQDCAAFEPKDEPLISLSEYFGDRILVSPQYYANGVPGAINYCSLRKSAVALLEDALNRLPKGLAFKVFDAWRPVSVQTALFNCFYDELKSENPGWDEARLIAETKKFVSLPSMDPLRPSVHNSGGAIDLTIIEIHNKKELDMGTGFDDFTDRSLTLHFEDTDCMIRDNRRLLYRVMTEAGFTNYPLEWWHYDYGDSFWSFYTGKPAIYGGITEEDKK